MLCARSLIDYGRLFVVCLVLFELFPEQRKLKGSCRLKRENWMHRGTAASWGSPRESAVAPRFPVPGSRRFPRCAVPGSGSRCSGFLLG